MDFINKIDLKISEYLNTRRGMIIVLLLVSLLFSLIVISRRPDAVTYPQFYAEDGVFWYSEAYSANNFWEPFLIPKQKYFQTVSRVGGFLGNLVDIGHAPLVFNAFAILFQILPALYFLSPRFSDIMPKFYLRFMCSLAYLSLLGTGEVHANLTNVQWKLALLMFLIIIVPASKKVGWKIFDNAMLLLAGLSGPFVFFAFPIAIVYFYYKSFKGSVDKAVVLGVTFLIQVYSFLFIVTDATRSKEELGASFVTFFKILAGNIFIRGISPDYAKKIRGFDLWENGTMPILIGFIGIALLGYVLWKAKLELRLFIAFTFLVFFAALASPQASLVKPQWEVLSGGSGGRYYFLPSLAWIMSLGWMAFNAKIKLLKSVAIVLLLCMVLIGLPKDWVFAKYKNYNFDQQVDGFRKVGIGENYQFKIAPKWDMYLKKK